MAYYLATGTAVAEVSYTEHPFTVELLEQYTNVPDKCVLVIDSIASPETGLNLVANQWLDEFATEFHFHVRSHLRQKCYTLRGSQKGLADIQKGFTGLASTVVTATLGGVTAKVNTANKTVWSSGFGLGSNYVNGTNLEFISDNASSLFHVILNPKDKYCDKTISDIKNRCQKTPVVLIAFEGVEVSGPLDVVLRVNNTAAFLEALKVLIMKRRMPQFS